MGDRTLRILSGIGLAAAIGLGGCGAATTGPSAPSSASPSLASPSAALARPLEETFGPTYSAQHRIGRLLAVDDGVLSQDKRTLTVTAIGSHGYSADNPCSADADGWLAVDGDALDVAVVEFHPDGQVPLGPNLGCTMEGYRRILHLRLAAPFLGTTVHDLTGRTLWVAPPAGLVDPTILPPDWTLQAADDEPGATPSLWVRVYAPGPVPNNGMNYGPGQLTIYQAFGAATQVGLGVSAADEQHHPVVIGGAPADVLSSAYSDEILVSFMVGDDGVSLDGSLHDVSIEEFTKIANGIRPAEP